MIKFLKDRRDMLRLSALGLGGAALGAATLTAQKAAAQSAPNSQLRTVLNRGKLLVGTGSTNAPWHFENEKGELVGMDIAMARILARGLFEDETKVEFVRQDPAQRIPNINTGKVDIVIQFMTVNPQRAQLVNFSRPYYVEGVALLTRPDSELKTFDALSKAGSKARISILQNADADATVKAALPQATVMQLDTQANVIQAIELQARRRCRRRPFDRAVARQAPARPLRRCRQEVVFDALLGSGAAGRSRLAAVRQHHVRRVDARASQRDLRHCPPGLFRDSAAGSRAGPSDLLTRPSASAPGRHPRSRTRPRAG